jgi:hypothetical protein
VEIVLENAPATAGSPAQGTDTGLGGAGQGTEPAKPEAPASPPTNPR